MISPEEAADLLIAPCPDSHLTAIQIPSNRGTNFRPPFIINFESLKACPEAQAALIEGLTQMISDENPSAIFGSGKERCSDIISGISQRLAISGGILLQAKQGSNFMSQDMIYPKTEAQVELNPEDLTNPKCALFTGMVLDLDFAANSIDHLRNRGYEPTVMISITDLEGLQVEKLMEELGLKYRYLVRARVVTKRPAFKERFGEATPMIRSFDPLRMRVRTQRIMNQRMKPD